MFDVIINFLNFALHPFETHALFAQQRGPILTDTIVAAVEVTEVDGANTNIARMPTFFELISLSWLFKIVETLYVITTIGVGFFAFKTVGGQIGMVKDLFQSELRSVHFIMIFWLLSSAVFYPFIALIYAKIWEYVINFCLDIFAINLSAEAKKKAVTEVVGYSFVANIFLVIPVLGNFISTIISFFYLFAGLKANLKMTTTQSIVVMLVPFLIVAGLGLLFFIWIILLFQSLFS